MAFTYETTTPDGATKTRRIFEDINENSEFYSFRSSSGLLSATQFTQPALTLMQKATFEDLRSRGLVSGDSPFAGHSLGEYDALSSITEVLPIESLVPLTFYRGLSMQVAIERDDEGRSNYAMCAIDPSRLAKGE